MTAICNENGFGITFDTLCRNNDYKAVTWSELYASGPTLNTANHVFGTGAYSECRFSDVNGDGSAIQMSFNFKQCGTTNGGSADTDNRIYYNKVQGQEYFADISVLQSISPSNVLRTESPQLPPKRMILTVAKISIRRTTRCCGCCRCYRSCGCSCWVEMCI